MHLRTFVQQAPASIGLFDRSMNYLAASRQWISDFGRGHAELVGMNHYEVHPDLPDRWKEIHRRGMQGETLSHDEDLWLQADGTEVWLRWVLRPWLNDRAEIGGIIILTEDITARKKAQETVRDREARLAAILDTAVDSIVTINEEGLIQSLNPATERMFGYTADELLGTDFGILMPSPYREAHSQYIVNYRRTGIPKIIGIGREVAGLRKDGTIFPIDLAVSEVDHLKLFTGIMRDLTHRQKLEQEIVNAASAERQRIGQDLHDSIGQQITGMSMLAAALSDSLSSEAPVGRTSPNSAKMLASHLQAGLESALQQIRAICRNLSPVPVDAQGLMMALETIIESVPTDLGIRCRLECLDPVTVSDIHVSTHLFQIAQGAFSNALRHSNAGEIVIGLEQRDSDLILTVRDDGVGIPTLTVPGFGLRIMHNRARIIGASLTITRANPTGTVVTCVLRQGDRETGRQGGSAS